MTKKPTPTNPPEGTVEAAPAYDPAFVLVDSFMELIQIHQSSQQIVNMGGVPSEQMREGIQVRVDRVAEAIRAIATPTTPKLVVVP